MLRGFSFGFIDVIGCEHNCPCQCCVEAHSHAERGQNNQLETLKGVDLFASGLQRGKEYTPEDLDEMVYNFNRYQRPGLQKAYMEVPGVLGHEETQEFLERTDLPAAAWLSDVWRDGYKLKGNFKDVPPQVAKLIRDKAYKYVSAEIYDEPPEGVPGQGKMLRRVAFLGGEIPQVKSLNELPMPSPASSGYSRNQGFIAASETGNRLLGSDGANLEPGWTERSWSGTWFAFSENSGVSRMAGQERPEMGRDALQQHLASKGMNPEVLKDMPDSHLAECARMMEPQSAPTETEGNPGREQQQEGVASMGDEYSDSPTKFGTIGHLAGSVAGHLGGGAAGGAVGGPIGAAAGSAVGGAAGGHLGSKLPFSEEADDMSAPEKFGVLGGLAGGALGGAVGGPVGAVGGAYLGHKVQQGAMNAEGEEPEMPNEEEMPPEGGSPEGNAQGAPDEGEVSPEGMAPEEKAAYAEHYRKMAAKYSSYAAKFADDEQGESVREFGKPEVLPKEDDADADEEVDHDSVPPFRHAEGGIPGTGGAPVSAETAGGRQMGRGPKRTTVTHHYSERQVQGMINRAVTQAVNQLKRSWSTNISQLNKFAEDRLAAEKRAGIKARLDALQHAGIIVPAQRGSLQRMLMGLDSHTVYKFSDRAGNTWKGTVLDQRLAEMERWPVIQRFGEQVKQNPDTGRLEEDPTLKSHEVQKIRGTFQRFSERFPKGTKSDVLVEGFAAAKKHNPGLTPEEFLGFSLNGAH